MDEHRCEEDDRRIEVQDSRHDRDERERGEQDAERRQRRPREPSADRIEELLLGRDLSNEQEPCNEYERTPGLFDRLLKHA
jgi:hypothetical protein